MLLGLLILWQALHVISGSADIPAPAQTGWRLWHMLGTGDFWRDGWATGAAFGCALLISVSAGVALGVALALHRQGAAVVEPLLSNFYALPKVTLYPVVLAFCGLGMAPKITFGVMHALVPITLLTVRAIEQIRPVHWRTAKSLRLSTPDTIRQVVLPAILPELIAAVRIGASLSLLGVLIGEMFAAKRGLGFAAMGAMGLGDTTAITAIGSFLAIIAVATNLLLLTAERRCTPGGSVLLK